MTELLEQAVILTGWGMGMTFLAIGALVIGMYLMSMVIKEKTETAADDTDETIADLLEEDNEETIEPLEINNGGFSINSREQYRALAASVAVALALSQDSGEKEPITSTTTPGVWNHYARGRQLSQRSRYEQLKHRR